MTASRSTMETGGYIAVDEFRFLNLDENCVTLPSIAIPGTPKNCSDSEFKCSDQTCISKVVISKNMFGSICNIIIGYSGAYLQL